MSFALGFVWLVAAGMLLSTAIYALSKRLGSNDPFAIELAAWWIFTDCLIISKLRNWNLRSAHEWVQQYPEAVVAGLIAVGLTVVFAAVALTRVDENGRFQVLDTWAMSHPVKYLLRSNFARAVVSMYCSLHLSLFLA